MATLSFSIPEYISDPIHLEPGQEIVGVNALTVGLADLNGDGRIDIFHAQHDHPTGAVLTTVDAWLQTPEGNFDALIVDPESRLSFPGHVFVKDFNRDGLPDIYVGTFGNELFPPTQPDVLYLQQHDGTYEIDTRTELPLTWAHGTSVGDLNDDGWLDVFSAGMSGLPSYVFWGSVNGFLVEETNYTGMVFEPPYVRDQIYRTRIQDFDGDGRSDLFIGASPVHQIIPATDSLPLFPSTIVYSYGRPDEETVELPFPDVPWMEDYNYEISNSQSADFDNDGDLDLILSFVNRAGAVVDGEFLPDWELSNRGLPVSGVWEHRIVQVLRNDGNRSWSDVTNHDAIGTQQFATAAFEIDVVDFNADGNWDISLNPSDNDGIFLGDGNLGFSRPDTINQPFGFPETVGDINGDGVVDITSVWTTDDGSQRLFEVVAAFGRGENTVWYGSSNDDAAHLNRQNEAHAGVGDDHIVGTDAGDRLWGDWNNDTLRGETGNDLLVGGHGLDVLVGGLGDDRAAYSGSKANHTVTLSPSGVSVEDRRPHGDGIDQLTSIEDLAFLDEVWHLDIFDNVVDLGEQAFRDFVEVYIAYFDRAPDAEGLFFYGTAFANGTSLEASAATFLNSAEYQTTYPSSLSNLEFAEAVYNNVLGRIPDVLGLNFWVGVLGSGAVGRSAFILDVLGGAKADPAPGATQEFVDQQLADRAYLSSKTDVGLYYSVLKGMSNVVNATTAMQLFDDGDQSDIDAAVAAIDVFYSDALDPANGEFLLQLVGIIDDPFSV